MVNWIAEDVNFHEEVEAPPFFSSDFALFLSLSFLHFISFITILTTNTILLLC